LIAFSILAVISPIPIIESSPDFVTETGTYIKVENNYFIAQVQKEWHGSIKYFYIKPDTTVNIVAPVAGGFEFLPGEEGIWAQNSLTRTSTDWGEAADKAVQTVSTVEETDDYVVIKAFGRMKQDANEWNYTIIRYWTFYVDKPYFDFYTKRIYNEDCSEVSNYQSCWLFAYDWVDKWYWNNETGQTEEFTSLEDWRCVTLDDMLIRGTYPWSMVYNTVNGNGFFTIVTQANLNLGMTTLSRDFGCQYSEYQIDWYQHSVKAGDEVWYKAVCGVATTVSYTENLVSTLYSGDAQTTFSNPQRVTVAEWADTNSYGRKATVRCPHRGLYFRPRISPFTGAYDTPYERAISSTTRLGPRFWWSAVYTNATGVYSTYASGASSNLNVSAYTWDNDGLHGNVTFSYVFEDKLQCNITVDMYGESDSYHYYYSWKALKSLNVTSLFARLYISGIAWQNIGFAAISNDVLKVNVSDYYGIGYYDEGFIVKNYTEVNRTITKTTNWFAYFYALKNPSDQLYSAGEVWSFKLLIQNFRRHSFRDPTYFGLSDIHEPTVSSNYFLEHEKQSWPRFANLSSYDFLSYSNGYIACQHWESSMQRLSLSIQGELGESSTTQFYTYDRGEPLNVSGASSWSYNVSTKILTLNLEHSTDRARIVVYWKISGDIDYDGDVDPDDFALFAGAYGTRPPSNPDCDLDVDDDVDAHDFAIFGANYGKTQT